MEILSSNRKRDLKTKKRLYEQARVPEYWIVDPEAREILVLTLDEGEQEYSQPRSFRVGEEFTSKVVTGLTMAVGDVFRGA